MKSSNKCVVLHVSPELQDAMINVREFLSALSVHAVTNLPTSEYVLVDDSRVNLNQIDTTIELLDTIQSAISYNNLQIDIGRRYPVNSIALQSYKTERSLTMADTIEQKKDAIKHGYWKRTSSEIGTFYCSECKHSEGVNYCPFCGAKMEFEEIQK